MQPRDVPTPEYERYIDSILVNMEYYIGCLLNDVLIGDEPIFFLFFWQHESRKTN